MLAVVPLVAMHEMHVLSYAKSFFFCFVFQKVSEHNMKSSLHSEEHLHSHTCIDCFDYLLQLCFVFIGR